MNTRSLTLIVGTLSFLLGLFALLSDTAAMGLAAGAVGLIAALMALLPTEGGASGSDRTAPGAPDATGSAASQDVAPTSRLADTPTDEAESASPAQGERAAPSAAVDRQFLTSTHNGDAEESDPLLNEAALMDPETDLFSEGYLRVALESRLASARRHLRPVALALLEVAEGLPDQGAQPASPTTVAEAVGRTLRDSDIACRMKDGTFAVILEDTPENGAVWTVERIRRNLVSTSGHHTLWAGVACYPAHAFDGPELLASVQQALDVAKVWNQDRIEVAVAE